MADDDLLVRIKAIGARAFKRDVDKSARAVDNFGDQAGQAARKLALMSKASGQARVNIGPVSTTARFGALAVGALAAATGKAATGLLGLAEASATVVGGAGAAGGVGLTALAQGMGTAKLATDGLSEALGGNEDALAKLNPAQAKFVAQLQDMQPMLDKLRSSAAGGLLGGAGKGLTSASKNFAVLNKIVRNTSGTLGGLAARAGKGLGSKRAGADLAAIGATNVRIIDSLGSTTLSLASAVGHVLVEAGPLAEWLADAAKRAAALTDEWVHNKRETGELSKFFRRARTDLSLLGSIGKNTAGGLINLFGAQDVDGRKTLASLERISARFEAWSRSAAVRGGVGQAIIDQIPKAAGGIASALAKTLGAAAPLAAEIFLKAFVNADIWGKALIGGVLAKKLGLGKIASKALGSAFGPKGGPLATLAARGSTPANPLFVSMIGTGALPGGGRGPVVTPPGGGGGSWLKSIPGIATVLLGGKAIGDSIDKKLKGPEHRNQPHNPTNPIGNWLRRLTGQATGGVTRNAGASIVGERGPEVLNLPRGARVDPLPMSGFDRPIHNVLMLDGRVVYEAYNRHDGREKARH